MVSVSADVIRLCGILTSLLLLLKCIHARWCQAICLQILSHFDGVGGIEIGTIRSKVLPLSMMSMSQVR